MKAISRIKDKESPLSSSSIQRQASVASQMSSEKAIKGSADSSVRHGTILVDHEVEYSSLLQQTVQSLRRKVTQLTMTKKLTNCELNLKPLPFVLLRDEIIEKIHCEIREKNKKIMKKVKIKEEKKEKK